MHIYWYGRANDNTLSSPFSPKATELFRIFHCSGAPLCDILGSAEDSRGHFTLIAPLKPVTEDEIRTFLGHSKFARVYDEGDKKDER